MGASGSVLSQCAKIAATSIHHISSSKVCTSNRINVNNNNSNRNTSKNIYIKVVSTFLCLSVYSLGTNPFMFRPLQWGHVNLLTLMLICATCSTSDYSPGMSMTESEYLLYINTTITARSQ